MSSIRKKDYIIKYTTVLFLAQVDYGKDAPAKGPRQK